MELVMTLREVAMKMASRLFVLGVVMLIGLVACGQAGGTTSTAPTASSSTAQVKPSPQPASPAPAGLTTPQQLEPTAQPGAPVVSSHGGPIKDHVSFVDHLRATGLTVDIVGDVQQPFLRAKGTQLHLSGGDLKQPVDIQSYNYDDTDLGTDGLAAAQADAAQIEPNGMPKTTNVQWNAAPHWFRTERVIVLYLGDDPAVLGLLTTLLGPQFAGQ